MHTHEPTREQFDAYRAMFAFFNRELFEGQLPEVLLNFSRHARSYGFFAPERWSTTVKPELKAAFVGGKHVVETRGARTHEISLNPDTLKERDAREVASTLVHEMVHLWQQELGTPPRRGYHDREWADKMESIGLIPSSTGAPGGKRVGQKMTHYIKDGGPFALAYAKLPSACALPWSSGLPAVASAGGTEKKRDPSKVKYTCEGCGANVWGKVGLRILCSECDQAFVEAA